MALVNPSELTLCAMVMIEHHRPGRWLGARADIKQRAVFCRFHDDGFRSEQWLGPHRNLQASEKRPNTQLLSRATGRDAQLTTTTIYSFDIYIYRTRQLTRIITKRRQWSSSGHRRKDFKDPSFSSQFSLRFFFKSFFFSISDIEFSRFRFV